MPHRLTVAAALLVAAACRTPAPGTAPPVLSLGDEVAVFDPSGRPVTIPTLQARLDAAGVVLLGELHDNAWHHRVRGRLIAAAATPPAVVFEQFPETGGPISPPAPGDSLTGWLDRHGFDRRAWRWPLHAPVVEAALAGGRAIRGSGVTREALRTVVREGRGAAAPAHRDLMDRAPLAGAAAAALDTVLVAGHCGQLPEAMVPGLRAAQEVRDAAMTRALLAAAADGPAWLIAGNGHVRRDFGVPRLLAGVAPETRPLVVGLLDRRPGEAVPPAGERALYDLVIVTPAAARDDPCASFRARPPEH